MAKKKPLPNPPAVAPKPLTPAQAEAKEQLRERMTERNTLEFKDNGAALMTVEASQGFRPLGLFEATGCVEDSSQTYLLGQTVFLGTKDPNIANGRAGILQGIAPQNETEGMIAAHMVLTHELAATMAARVVSEGQTQDGADRNINRAIKLMRAFNESALTLHKLRTGGKQTVVVQHQNVTVSEGGQAVIAQGGGGNG